jgi:hypothetical protein
MKRLVDIDNFANVDTSGHNPFDVAQAISNFRTNKDQHVLYTSDYKILKGVEVLMAARKLGKKTIKGELYGSYKERVSLDLSNFTVFNEQPKVIELLTNKVYASATEAAKATGKPARTIIRHCGGDVKDPLFAFIVRRK